MESSRTPSTCTEPVEVCRGAVTDRVGVLKYNLVTDSLLKFLKEN